MTLYNVRDHYWLVAGNSKRVWSSAVRDYVAADDDTFIQWMATGGTPTPIVSEQELWDVLAVQAPDRVPEDSAAQERLSAQVFAELPPALHALLLDQDNRLRAIEGKPALSAEQYRDVGKTVVRDNFADVVAVAAEVSIAREAP
jgi:hypothetical protein